MVSLGRGVDGSQGAGAVRVNGRVFVCWSCLALGLWLGQGVVLSSWVVNVLGIVAPSSSSHFRVVVASSLSGDVDPCRSDDGKQKVIMGMGGKIRLAHP